MGYLIQTDPDPQRSKGQVSVVENDTFTCIHCSRIVKLVYGDPKPGREAFEVNVKDVTWCTKCMAPICNPCRRFSCDPIEKKLGRYEKKHGL
jgi:hypothetical protein